MIGFVLEEWASLQELRLNCCRSWMGKTCLVREILDQLHLELSSIAIEEKILASIFKNLVYCCERWILGKVGICIFFQNIHNNPLLQKDFQTIFWLISDFICQLSIFLWLYLEVFIVLSIIIFILDLFFSILVFWPKDSYDFWGS